MTCVRCGSPNVIVEGLGSNKTRIVCQKCRHESIMDSTGRQLLTGDNQSRRNNDKRILLEG